MAISGPGSTTVISTETARELAECDGLGAGNVLEHAVRRTPSPGAPSIWLERAWEGFGGPVVTFSLASLSRVVDRYASVYHAAGVGPRDIVALLVGEGIAPIVHYLALTRLGAIPAPINGHLPPAAIEAYARRIAPRRLVADEALLARLDRGLDVEVLDVEPGAAPAAPPAAGAYRHAPDDPVLLVHTSGTTAPPKPVTVLHGPFLHAVRARLVSSVRTGERVLSAAPHTHAAGIASFLTSTLRGAAKLVLSDLSAPNVLVAIESFRPTTVVAFAGVYAELAALDLEGHDLGSVDQWIATGDASHRRHVAALLSAAERSRGPGRARCVFVDGFGSSELGNTVFRRASTLDDVADGRHLGRPAEYVRVAVLDEHGSELPAGRIGRLGVVGPTLTPGYWNDSEMTYRSRLAGYWLTGDLAWRDAAGDHYHADRVADAFECAGRLVCTVLMEELILDAQPDVHNAAVFGIAATDGGMVPAVVVRPARPGVRAQHLLDHVNETMADRGEAPCHLLLVAEQPADWPLGPTGKVLKRCLRERFRDALRDPQQRRELAAAGTCAFLDEQLLQAGEHTREPLPG